MKTKIKYFFVIIISSIGILLAYLYLGAAIIPFENLSLKNVKSVAINTTQGAKQLDDNYAEQVLDSLSQIETYLFFNPVDEWNNGSIGKMFVITLSDGHNIWVGENFPNIVIEEVQYRISQKSKPFFSNLISLYRSHPDHFPFSF